MKNLSAVYLYLLLSIFIAGCGGGSGGTDLPPPPPPSPETYISAQNTVEKSGFRGSILVRKGANDILRQGFGMADHQTAQANHVDTQFRIGSLTKAFTAVAIIQLKNGGLITSYDDPVSTYYEDLSQGADITLRDLLNHRSGLVDFPERVDITQHYSPEQLVELIDTEPLMFAPGSQFNYANINYVLLGLIIERLSGQDYYQYLEQHIFQALGMTFTEVSRSHISGDNYARGYQAGNTEAEYHDMSIPFSAGALTSNLQDLERFADTFIQAGLLTEQNLETIFNQGEYGFGWSVGQDQGQKVYFHSGKIAGFSSMIIIAPESDGLIIALSNEASFHDEMGPLMSELVKHEFK